MLGKRDTSYSLICAVREGRLESVRELIDSFGLYYSPAWSGGYVLLRDAIENEQTAVTKLLLTNGCKVNSKNQNPSNTPLHFAVINGNIEIVEMLLDRGANIDAENQSGRTPLHNAAEKGSEEIIKLLLSRGAIVDAKRKDGTTPLHIAAERGYLQIVEHLLKHGAYINSTSREGYTPLFLAVEKGSEEMIKLLLSRGANVDAKVKDHFAAERGYLQIIERILKNRAYINSAYTSTSYEGYTPLCLAVKKGSEEIIKLLLNGGANVDAKGKDGITPLHIAAERGYLQIVEHLLKHGAYINSAYTSTSREGYTPLWFAVEKEHEKVVKLLLEYGANVDAQDKDGKTILHFAVEKGHTVIVEHTLKHCPDVNNKSSKNALNVAVHGYGKEYSKIVANLLQYGFTVNPEDVNNCKLLHTAVEKGYLKIVDELLKYGTDVNMLYSSTGYMPLHVATKNKNEEMAKLLISYGADVNAQNETGKAPIFYATENADLKITKLLLTNIANVKDNPELLSIAVKKECREIVEVLLQHGADVNTSDTYGRTALHFTALGKDRGFFGFLLDKDPDINVKGEIAKLLLSRGASVNAQTKNGLTTLHAATYKGYVKVVEALLEYNADVNSTFKNDMTPLHLSAKTGNEVIIKMLLNKGANINANQKDRLTALHIATLKGHKEVVEVLLKCGAKVDSKSKSDKTPLHIAALRGYPEFVEILLKFGADIDSRDECGRTALHIASKEGHKQVVIALLKYGSDVNIMSINNYTPLDYATAGISSFYNQPDNYDSDNDYYYNDRGICACEEIAEILKHHIVKMKTANLYVNKKNLRSIISNNEISDFQNECEEEMESIKSEKISNTNVTFHDILTKSISCARNENIVQVLKLDDYKTKFPIYASMINSNFSKGVERKELLEQGNKFVHSLFNRFPELPYNCTEQIFSHLSNKDLRILIDACKPANVSSPNTDINDVTITSKMFNKSYASQP